MSSEKCHTLGKQSLLTPCISDTINRRCSACPNRQFIRTTPGPSCPPLLHAPVATQSTRKLTARLLTPAPPTLWPHDSKAIDNSRCLPFQVVRARLIKGTCLKQKSECQHYPWDADVVFFVKAPGSCKTQVSPLTSLAICYCWIKRAR